MAHFTKLDDEAIAQLSEAFALGTLRRWKSIAAGTINSNYQIETSEGLFFLRVNEGKGLPQVQLEIDVLTHLASKGFPTPLPRESRGGERFARWQDKFISVFDWLPGSHVDSQSIRDPHCHSAGRRLAALHLAGDDMDLRQVGEGRYAYEEIRKLFETFADSEDPTLERVTPILREEFAWLDSQADLRAAEARGLIHADLFPDNALLEEDAIVCLLDFEQACVGSRVYDLAVAINAWCFADSLEPSRVRALVAGYQELRPLEEADRLALPVELRASALRFTVTRITDIYLPGLESGATQTGKDFRRFLMRLKTWQELEPRELERIADLAQTHSED
jgi:homoserine kinase type II